MIPVQFRFFNQSYTNAWNAAWAQNGGDMSDWVNGFSIINPLRFSIMSLIFDQYSEVGYIRTHTDPTEWLNYESWV
jgi:hypothetical protein